MVKKDCNEECCSEHSGVVSRLGAGNWIFGIAATVLIAIFGIQATNNARTTDALICIQVAVGKIETSLPQTKAAIDDIQQRTRELERRTAGGRQ